MNLVAGKARLGYHIMARRTITGLLLHADCVEWTTLASGNKKTEKLAFKRTACESSAAEQTEASGQSALLAQYCSDLKGPIVVGIAPAQMLLRVADLPAADPNETADMIRLQVVRFAPFPEDSMAVSYEILQTAENINRILIAAMPRETVETLGAAMRAAGLSVERIDAEAMGWWQLLLDHKAVPQNGRHVFLILEASGGLWIATQNGSPLAFKAAGPAAGLTAEEYAAELAEDLRALVISLDMEHGAAPVGSLVFWQRAIETEPIRQRLIRELQGAIVLRALEELPPLSEGLARRVMEQPFIAPRDGKPRRHALLDFVPLAWRVNTLATHNRRRLIITAAVALGVWAAGLSAFLIGYQINHAHLKRLEQQAAQLHKPAEDVRLLQRQIKSFELYLNRTRSALECLRETSALLPEEVELTNFQFKKGKNVTIRGEALSVNPIYDFKKALDQSALFRNIEMGSTQPSKRRDITVQTFQMNAQFPEDKQ